MTRREIGSWSVRWDQQLADAAYAHGYWSRQTLADALIAAARETPDRVITMDGETILTASNLQAQAERLAAWLQARSKPGDVVSFMLPNWHEAAIIYLGATLAGLVVNPILPSLRDHDLRFILQDCRSRFVFIPQHFRKHDYAAMLARVAQELKEAPEIVIVRGQAYGASDFNALLNEKNLYQAPSLDPDHVHMVMYTSGTTGRPKGVLHTENTLRALLMQIGQHWLIEPGDRFLVPSPVSHIGGSIYAFEAPLLLGTTAILMDEWDSGRAIGIMQAQGVTHMAGATPFLQQLLASARAANGHLDDLKVFICGGASVPPSLVESAVSWFSKARVSRVYGSTEVPVTTVGALSTRAMHEAASTDGKPGFADVRLSADNEIMVKGPQMFAGYIRQEDEQTAFDAEGYYRTGDQGRWESDGYLVVTGRLKDLIIRNGENISPKEIEDLLIGHPGIADIAIVGIPDAKTGERACAVIVPKGQASPDIASLSAFLSEQGVARFKFPERVELRAALPRNDAGKVLKHVLRAGISP